MIRAFHRQKVRICSVAADTGFLCFGISSAP